MRIWIDLANSPHVPFFKALINPLMDRGHDVLITARDFAETVTLAVAGGLNVEVIGAHGGRSLKGKAGNLVQRSLALVGWAHSRDIDLALSHNSYTQLVAAQVVRIPSVTLMDFEHQPANHLAFRLAAQVIVPRAFPPAYLLKYGAAGERVQYYDGTKEDVYLADFQPDPVFRQQLITLGLNEEDVLVLMRPPAHQALYHRFHNELFDEVLNGICSKASVKILLLARNGSQRQYYAKRYGRQIIQPDQPIDGPNLIAYSDLVISAGGTMNREAAALGVPAISLFAGKWAAIDEYLMQEGRMTRIESKGHLDRIVLRKKPEAKPRRALNVRNQILDLVLKRY